MRIAIIGAGNVGGGLAGAATTRGARRRVLGQQPRQRAGDRGDDRRGGGGQQRRGRRRCGPGRLRRPGGAVAGIAAELAEALAGKIVVDATNPLNETYTDLTTAGVSAAELLQPQLPGATVVKAFNTVFAAALRRPHRGRHAAGRAHRRRRRRRQGHGRRSWSTSLGLPVRRRGWPADGAGAGGDGVPQHQRSTPATAGPGRAPGSWSARPRTPPMTVNPVRLNHAVLFVADLERSRCAFYTEAFGMDGRRPRAARERRVPAAAPLGQPPRPRPVRRRRRSRRDRAARIGLYHLAWQVDTIDELEQARLTPGRRSAPTPASPATAPPRASTAPTPTATSSR